VGIENFPSAIFLVQLNFSNLYNLPKKLGNMKFANYDEIQASFVS
jgi:hypothetical protein